MYSYALTKLFLKIVEKQIAFRHHSWKKETLVHRYKDVYGKKTKE